MSSAGAPQPSEPRMRTLDADEWEQLRLREFPGERCNLNAGTLGTPARSVLAAQRALWHDDLHAWPLGQYRPGREDLHRARALAHALLGRPRSPCVAAPARG